MKKKKLAISIISILLLCLVIFLAVFFTCRNNDSNNNEDDTAKVYSVFVWSIDEINFSYFEDVVGYMDIGTIYLCGKTSNNEVDFSSNLYRLYYDYAERLKLKTYIIYDKNYSSFNQSQNSMQALLDSVYNFNKTSSYKISGMAVDWEFHTTPEYASANRAGRIEMFENYVSTMKGTYNYAKEKGLKFVPCIPADYDTLSLDYLEDLIANGCDYLQIMNYKKDAMIENIANEITLSKNCNKRIETIAELQKPNSTYDVTDDITFYNDGIEKCQEKFNEIKDFYKYDKLTFSYHYYTPLTELLNGKLDYSNKFTYELYPKGEQSQTINLQTIYLQNGKEKIYGHSTFHATAQEYIIFFFGVEYSKEYELIVEDEIYKLSKPKFINYNNSTDTTKYDEIYCVKKINTR